MCLILVPIRENRKVDQEINNLLAKSIAELLPAAENKITLHALDYSAVASSSTRWLFVW